MPAPSFGWYCYPWNILAPQAMLSEMRDAGMSHVTIAASYHAGKFIQPRAPMKRVYFPEDGTVYFDADPARYGVLKPRKSSSTAERDVLREVCNADMLAVRAWTVLNHNSRLGASHPEVVARNAWGDPYHYSLCPAHGDVQDYAVALCADLADGYALDSLLLETPGWLTYDHGYHHEFAQVAASAEASALLGLCFCAACTTEAAGEGINVAGLRRWVIARCDTLMSGADAGPPAAHAELEAFYGWRCSIVTALCARIRAAVRPEVGVRVVSTCQRPHRTSYLEGGDLAGMHAATDGLELPIYQPSSNDAGRDLNYVLDQIPAAAHLGVILRPGAPDMASEQQLAETLALIAAAGIGDVSFYNYDLLPAENLDWVRRALPAFRESLSHA